MISNQSFKLTSDVALTSRSLEPQEHEAGNEEQVMVIINNGSLMKSNGYCD